MVSEGERSDAFAYVLDVVPTLLDLAGVMPEMNGKAPIMGRSMVGLLSGKAKQIYTNDESIGYEAAGGAALYSGDYKLVRSAPPYGDAKWRLYDLRSDPTESHDLMATRPDLAISTTAAFTAYVKENGVILVPDGYDVIAQARKNAALKQ